jgi:Spy/CpxP family protein refolding chaperone
MLMLKLFPAGLLFAVVSGTRVAAAQDVPAPGAMPPADGYGMDTPRPGMMESDPHHYGMGPGPDSILASPPPFAGVQFTEVQRKRINEMMTREREAHQQRVALMERAQARLQQLYEAEIWDAKAINAVYDKIFAEQRKTIEAMAKARNTIYKMLSDEQRSQMKQFQLHMRRLAPPPQS